MSSTITPYEFFFDGQQKRFIEQVVRAFSGFSYQTGMSNGQPPQTIMVPCTYAYTNRQVAQIVSQVTENFANAIPHIVVYQTGLKGRKEDLQNRTFIDHLQVFERDINNGKYGPGRGNAYNLDRLMPVPFNMELQVDVWVSNLEQKHQLLEQMLIALFPDFQIQNSDNALDWTANTICYIDEDITFSSRSVPIGTNDDIDYFSLHLRIPIYLTPPAKLKKLNRIEEIIANVGDLSVDQLGVPSISTIYQTVIVTPGEHFIRIDGTNANVITLLADKACDVLPNGSLPSWTDLFAQYGSFQPNVSQLHLLLSSDVNGSYMTGTLALGNGPNEVIWTIDPSSIPQNTIQPINAFIDPLDTFPGHNLPTPTNGVRYLLLNPIGQSTAWGYITANTNDIIEYSNTGWFVSFDSKITYDIQYVTNLFSGNQFYWDGSEWIRTISNFYEPGFWRLAL